MALWLTLLQGGTQPISVQSEPTVATHDHTQAWAAGPRLPRLKIKPPAKPVPAPKPASASASKSSPNSNPQVAGQVDTTARNAHLAGKKHPVTGVPFDAEGFPDFRAAGVVQKEVRITYTGTRTGDVAAANKAAGLTSTPTGMRWHHHQDGTTMQLVPADIHTKTGHVGGFGLSK